MKIITLPVPLTSFSLHGRGDSPSWDTEAKITQQNKTKFGSWLSTARRKTRKKSENKGERHRQTERREIKGHREREREREHAFCKLALFSSGMSAWWNLENKIWERKRNWGRGEGEMKKRQSRRQGRRSGKAISRLYEQVQYQGCLGCWPLLVNPKAHPVLPGWRSGETESPDKRSGWRDIESTQVVKVHKQNNTPFIFSQGNDTFLENCYCHQMRYLLLERASKNWFLGFILAFYHSPA